MRECTRGDGAGRGLLSFDLERKNLTRRLTTHPGEDFGAVWHPDGRQLALTTELDDTPENPGPGMAWMPEPGGPLESLIKSPGWGNWEFPSSWSPDGASLAFLARRTGRADIALTSVDKRGEWMPFLETTAMEAAPAFSPDGRWLAYVSDETGRDEVYVRPFPGPSERTPISSGGGIEPVWARDGRALFFRHGDRIMESRVDGAADRFIASAPEPVVVGVRLDDWTEFGAEIPNYDVSPDGARFIMARRKEPAPATVIDVVLNWPETLFGASEAEH